MNPSYNLQEEMSKDHAHGPRVHILDHEGYVHRNMGVFLLKELFSYQGPEHSQHWTITDFERLMNSTVSRVGIG